ncbi:MAG: hypothetical protein ACUVT3_11585, partial [Ignavibacterium sp.]
MNYEHIVEPSYIIFREDGKILARNGKTGVIDYAGTNASEVIYLAINALTTGGEIIIKTGTYLISATIGMKSNVHLKGESNVIFQVASGVNLGVDGILRLAYDIENVTIENIVFDGNKANNATSSAIYIRRVSNVLIRKCTFKNFAGIANTLYLQEYVADNKPPSKNIHITDNYFIDIDEVAISVDSDSEGLQRYIMVNNNVFKNCVNEYGVIRFARVYDGSITNNFIINTGVTGTKTGIRVYGFNKNIIVSNNVLIDTINKLYFSMIEVGHSDSVSVVNNNIVFTENVSVEEVHGILVQPNCEDVTVNSNILEGNNIAGIQAGIYLHGSNESSIDIEKVVI